MRLDQHLRSLDDLDEVQLARLALRATEALQERLSDHPNATVATVVRRGWAPVVAVAVDGLRILHGSLARHMPPEGSCAAPALLAAMSPAGDCPSDSLLQDLG